MVRGSRCARYRSNGGWLRRRLRLRLVLALLLVGETSLRRPSPSMSFSSSSYEVSTRQTQGSRLRLLVGNLRCTWRSRPSRTSFSTVGLWLRGLSARDALSAPRKRVLCVGAVGSSGLAGWSVFEAVSGFAASSRQSASILGRRVHRRGGKRLTRRLTEADLLLLAGLFCGCFFLLATLFLLGRRCWSQAAGVAGGAPVCAWFAESAGCACEPDLSRNVCVLSRKRVLSTLAFFFGAGGTYALKLMLGCDSA